MSEHDAARRRNQRVVEGAVAELYNLENVVTDALARLPAVVSRIQALRAELVGLLPRNEPAGASSEPESAEAAQGQLTG